MNSILTVLTIILHSVTNVQPISATNQSHCWLYSEKQYNFISDIPHCFNTDMPLDDTQKQSTQDNPTIDTVPSNNPVIVVVDNPVQVNDTKKDKGNNGNHYGNDKSDNNPNDIKNKHNGCDSNCTGKDNPNPKNDKKKDK